MAQEPALSIAPAAWCDEAEAALMPAAFGDMPIVKAEHRAGLNQLWRLGGCASGWLVTRVEGRELVLVMGAGRNARAVIRHCKAVAQQHGMTVRAHIRRRGMQRIYEREGFSLREVVMGA